MLSLKYATYRSFLKHKVLMIGCELAIVGELYTTTTHGACGNLNRKVWRGGKVFKCQSNECQFVSGRDESAGRNIALRQIKRRRD